MEVISAVHETVERDARSVESLVAVAGVAVHDHVIDLARVDSYLTVERQARKGVEHPVVVVLLRERVCD
jgi:hypothetical protein